MANGFRQNSLNNFKGQNIKTPSGAQQPQINSLENIENNILISVCGLLGTLIYGQQGGINILQAKSSSLNPRVRSLISKAGEGLLGSTNNIKAFVREIGKNSRYNKQIYNALEVIKVASQDYLQLRNKALSDQVIIKFFKDVSKILKTISENNKFNNRNNQLKQKITLYFKGDDTILEIIKSLRKHGAFGKNTQLIKQLLDPDNPDSILGIIEALNNISKTVNSKKVHNALESIIKFIQTIVEISSVNKKQIKKATDNTQLIKQSLLTNINEIVDGLKDADKLTKQHKETFDALIQFYKSVQYIGSIKYVGVVTAKNNIKVIKTSIIKNVVAIIDALSEAKSLTKQHKTTIEILHKFYNVVSSIGEIDTKQINQSKENVNVVAKSLLKNIIKIIDALSEAKTMTQKHIKSIEALQGFIRAIWMLGGNISKRKAFVNVLFIKFFIVKSVNDIIQALVKANQKTSKAEKNIESLQKFIELIFKLGQMDKRARKNAYKSLDYIKDVYIPKIGDIIKKMLKQIDEKDLNILEKRHNKLKKILGSNIQEINDEVNKQKYVDSKKLHAMQSSLAGVAKLVIASGAVLIIGSLFMKIIDPKDLILFTGTLLIFTTGIIAALTIASNKKIFQAIQFARSISLLILTIGFTLVLGSLIMNSVDVRSLFKFLFGFALMMAATLDGLAELSRSNLTNEAFKSLKDICLLIMTIGFTLALGSLIMTLVDWDSWWKFTIGYLFIMLVTIGGLALIKKTMEEADTLWTLVGITVLIMGIGFTLALGSLIMTLVDWPAWIKFMLGYCVIIAATLLGLWLVREILDKSDVYKTMVGIAVLILAIGFTLALGSLVMKFVKLEDLGLFLGGYVIMLGLTIGALWLIGKFKEQTTIAIETAWSLAIIMLGIAASMAIGSFAMKYVEWPDLWKFLAGYAVMMGGIILFFRLVNKSVLIATETAWALAIIMLAIAGTMFLGSMAMKYVKWEDLIKFLVGFAGMTLCVIGILAIASTGVTLSLVTAAALVIIMLSVTACMILGTKAMKHTKLEVLDKFLIGFAKLALGTAGLLALISPTAGIAIIGAAAVTTMMLSLYTAAVTAEKVSKTKVDMKSIKALLKAIELIASTVAGFWKYSFVLPLVSASLLGLETVITRIAIAVQNYSSLKIPVYEGTKVKEYRTLTQQDFKEAAKNVSKIVSTLGGAVISAYERNPEIFEVDFFGRSKFAKVCKSLGKLGPMISDIAEGVRDYAALSIVTRWQQKNGVLVPAERQIMDKSNFQKAAENIQQILDTLGKSVVQAYEEHPEYYDSGLITNSPFTKVTKALGNLGPMIAKIAEGVKDYANMYYVSEWHFDAKNNRLVPKDKKRIEESDFKEATKNIQHILDTLGKAVIRAYEEHPEYYDSGIITNSPFTKVTKALGNLGPMISNIAEGVKDYANMYYVSDWHFDTKNNRLVPKAKKRIDDNDFKEASQNIQHILDTLGKGVIRAYEEHPEYYDSSGLLSNSIFTKVTKALGNLGPMIAKIAEGVKDYANLTVTEWGLRDNKLVPIARKRMTEEDFKSAARNVNRIISTLGNGIIEFAEEHSEWLGEDGDYGDNFKSILSAVAKLGDVISGIGQGVLNMANGKIEIYDKDGKVIGYEHLSQKHFDLASDNISSIVSNLGQSIIDTVQQHEDWFDDGEDSVFAQSCKSISAMGNMISDIAQGIQNYANLKFPIYEGTKIKGYEELSETKLTDASKNIGTVVSTLATTIYKLSKGDMGDGVENKELAAMFEEPTFFGENKFSVVVRSVTGMGDMLNGIAEGMVNFSKLQFPIYKPNSTEIQSYVGLTDENLQKAAENIGNVVGTLGFTIMCLYQGKLYNGIVNGKISTLSLDGMTPELAAQMFDTKWYESDNPFSRVVKSLTSMGEMISNIAEGIQEWASMNFPDTFDAQGKPLSYKHLGPEEINKAKESIGAVITTLGDALMTAYGDHKEWFEVPDIEVSAGFGLFSTSIPNNNGSTPFMNMMKALSIMGNVITSVADGIRHFASMNVPTAWDSDGKPTDFKNLTDTDLKTAAIKIGDVLLCLGKTVAKTYEENKDLYENSAADKISNSFAHIGKAVRDIALAIKYYVEMKVPEFNESGVFTGNYKKLEDTDIQNAQAHISQILLAIGTSIASFANSPFIKENEDALNTIAVLYGKIGQVLPEIAKAIATYANLETPIYKDGKIVGSEKLGDTEKEQAIKQIKDVLTGLGTAIVDAIKEHPELFGDPGWFTNNPENAPAMVAATAIGKMATPISNLADTLKAYSGGRFRDENGNVVTLSHTELQNSIIWIKRVVKGVSQAIYSVWKEHGEMFEDSAKYDLIIGGLTKAASTIGSLANYIKTIHGELSEIDLEACLTSIDQIIETYINSLKTLNGISEDSADVDQRIVDIVSKSITNGTIATMKAYVDLIDDIIDLSIKSQDAGSEGYDILKHGIEQVTNATNNIQSVEIFRQHQDILDKYVKSVNNIQLNKVDSLILLTLSANALAHKLGNVDSLTKAIAHNLSEALIHLSNKLQEAKETILKAEEIQDKRHKKIDDSVKNVKEIMSQTLHIDIKKVNDTTSLTPSPSPGGGSNTYSTPDSPGGGGGGGNAGGNAGTEGFGQGSEGGSNVPTGPGSWVETQYNSGTTPAKDVKESKGGYFSSAAAQGYYAQLTSKNDSNVVQALKAHINTIVSRAHPTSKNG